MKIEKIFKVITALLIVISIETISDAQFLWDPGIAQKGVKGITNVASSIVSDSFTPMTHYQKNELTVTCTPSYFKIRRLFDDPDLEGDDLNGWSLSLGGGYALTEKLMFYGIFSYMDINGNVEGNFYGYMLPEVDASSEFTIYSILSGVGFDILGGNEYFSMPIYAGLSFLRYSFNMGFPIIQYSPGYFAELSMNDSSYLIGFTLGVAFSVKIFNCLKLSPYLLYIRSFNKPAITFQVFSTGIIPIQLSQELSLGNLNAGMFGFSLTIASSRSFSFSASLGGLLSSSTGFYNKTFLDGLNMISIVLAVTYRQGHVREE